MNKNSKKIQRLIGKAINDFNLIEAGDKILVGLSGGKDSLVLLYFLEQLRRKAPIDFQITAVTVQYHFREIKMDLIENFCKKINVKHHLLQTNINKIIEEKNNGRSVCSFCSRLRRGHLYTFANNYNFNKIALGHHREDLNETLLMNLFYSGTLESIPAKLIADDSKNIVIRPMIYVPEKRIIDFVKNNNIQVVKSDCIYEKVNKRDFVKKQILELEKKIPGIKNSMLAAQKNIKLSQLLGN